MKPTRRTTRRILSLLAATVVGTAGALGVSSPASAHHPVVEGVATCQTNGTYTVEWTVTNSEWDIKGKIISVTQNGQDVSFGDVEVPDGDLQNLPKGGSVTGTQTNVAGDTTSLSLTVKAEWWRKWFGSRWKRIEAERTGWAAGWADNCVPRAPQPEAHVASTCDEVVVTLTNSGNLPATFTVIHEGGSQAVTVDPGGEKKVNVPKADADGSDDAVKVLVGDSVIESGKWMDPQTCGAPVVETANTCDTFTIKVTNPSDGSATLGGSFKPAGGLPVPFFLAKGTGSTQAYTTAGLSVVIDFDDSRFQDETKTWVKDEAACAPPPITTPAPTTPNNPELADTGQSLTTFVVAGGVLVAGGAALLSLLLLRRRRATTRH